MAREIVEIEETDGRRGVLENAGEAEAIEITSDRCDFDRNDGVILFEGHAGVRYSAGYTMNGDRLFIFLVGSNRLDRIICEGGVVLTNDTRVGCCARAVFRRGTGEIVMSGGADGSLARLAEQGVDEVAGRSIRFWVDTEQVEVDGSELTVETGGKRMKTEKGGRQ